MLDQTLDVLTRISWVVFLLVIVIYFFQTLFKEGFGAALQVLFGRLIITGLFFMLLLTAINTSLVFVEPQQVGVVVSLVSPEGVREQPFRSGLHWIIPLAEQAHIYPIFWQNYTMSAKPMEGQLLGNDAIVARTSDGQEVIIDCSVIFRIEAEQVIRIHIDWQNRYVDDFIRPIVRGIVRTEVSQFTIDEVNSSKRRDIETRLDTLVREQLSDKGFILDRFVLRNIAFSNIYAASVEQKQVALQEIIRNQYMADQVRELARGRGDEMAILAQAEATAISVKAEAQAQALTLLANAVQNNPDLLTYEYINKIAPNVRVMLLPNDAPLILPAPDLYGPPSPADLMLTATPTPIPSSTPTTPVLLFPTATPTSTPTPLPLPQN